MATHRTIPRGNMNPDAVDPDPNRHPRWCSCDPCLEACPFNRNSAAWYTWAFGEVPESHPKYVKPKEEHVIQRVDGLLPGDHDILMARLDARAAAEREAEARVLVDG